MHRHKWNIANDAHEAVDVVRIVDNGADLATGTNSNWSKNIGTSTHKSINLKLTAASNTYYS